MMTTSQKTLSELLLFVNPLRLGGRGGDEDRDYRANVFVCKGPTPPSLPRFLSKQGLLSRVDPVSKSNHSEEGKIEEIRCFAFVFYRSALIFTITEIHG